VSGQLVMLLGAGLIGLGFVLVLLVIGTMTTERRSVARSVAAVRAIDSGPAALTEEIDRPFAERVIAPLGERMVGLGRRLVRADTASKLQYRLNVAGNPPAWDVNRLLGLKVLGLGVLGTLGFLYLLGTGWPLPRLAIGTVLLGSLGYCLPNILLQNAGQKREKLMRNGLPDAMDLLTISVEAGLGFDAAVSRVAKNGSGPLNQEFARLLQEMQLGLGRTEAMRAMAERTSLPELKSFCMAMVQADNLGIPIARVLRIQSQEMRTKRRQRAEEKAQQVPVKIMIPLVLFILPCLFLVVLGPAGIQMAGTFSSM
jgi:tight adherence protein C